VFVQEPTIDYIQASHPSIPKETGRPSLARNGAVPRWIPPPIAAAYRLRTQSQFAGLGIRIAINR
jgi:hypothetical protein